MAAGMLERIGGTFRRVGWIGVWVQLILALVPLGMLIYALMGKLTGSRPSLQAGDILAIAGLSILVFTTLWSYRYVMLGQGLQSPDRKPTHAKVTRALWVGLWASCAGIVVTVSLMLVEVVRMLFLLLKAPQGGVPVIRTEPQSRTEWVSAMDVVSLLAELCTLIGELAILGFTLYLLFMVVRYREAFPDAAPAASPPPAAP